METQRPGARELRHGHRSGISAGIGCFHRGQDRIDFASGAGNPAGILPRLKQFTIAGIFQAGHFEYDSSLVLIHLADAQKLYRMGDDEVSGVRLKLRDLFHAPQVVQELGPMISAEVYISDWSRQHANYFRAIQIEKRMLSLILALIIAVAAFNIVSTLVMAVTDKQSDIAILRTLGASPRSIMKVFIVQGTLIGVLGTTLGVIGGVLLAYNIEAVIAAIEHVFSVQFLSREVYYISEIPSDLQLADVVTVAVVSFVLTLLATLYPSYRASKVNPAEALGMNESIISCRDLRKSYYQGKLEVPVLLGIDLDVPSGDTLAVVGASGSGKSTLLHLLGGLDAPTGGDIRIMGQDIAAIDEEERCKLRNRSLGFIYQFHHLLPEFSALENVAMPLLIRRINNTEAYKSATESSEAGGPGPSPHPHARRTLRRGASACCRWRGRWLLVPPACWRMNPPAISTVARPEMCST